MRICARILHFAFRISRFVFLRVLHFAFCILYFAFRVLHFNESEKTHRITARRIFVLYYFPNADLRARFAFRILRLHFAFCILYFAFCISRFAFRVLYFAFAFRISRFNESEKTYRITARRIFVLYCFPNANLLARFAFRVLCFEFCAFCILRFEF